MRIAIVTGHFMPEIGYQEVYLAKAFSKLGHQVRVITSNKPSPSAKYVRKSDYAIGLENERSCDFSILRLPPLLAFGSIIVAREIKRAISEWFPEFVIVIGVGKFFPLPILIEPEKRSYKLITLFGDNSDFSGLNSIKSKLLKQIVRNRLYRKAVRCSDKLCLYTPETESIVLSYLPAGLEKVLREKRALSTLGYDPDEFYFDEQERQAVREQLDIGPDEVVFITSTRVTPRKTLENVIEPISKLYTEGKRVRYIMIGLLGDDYEERLKTLIKRQPNPEIFYCYPFSGHSNIRQLYCASDIGIWLKAAISIQEAMGTGLPVILENKPSVNHLVQDGMNGWYFEKRKLFQVIEKAVLKISKMDEYDRIAYRNNISENNFNKLSYIKIADQILKGLN